MAFKILEDGAAAFKRGEYATAMRLFRPLADQGNAKAQFALGRMYADGLGVPQNYFEAAKWYRKAAQLGLASAQATLGIMYKHGGLSVPRNYFEAVKWFRLAADQGHALAQLGLGHMYYMGPGVPQNYVQAHMWHNLAAGNRALDKTGRDLAGEGRDLAASKMTPLQITEAQKLASEWKPKP